MADSRDLAIALDASRLRLTPIEEVLALDRLGDIERRIRRECAEKKDVREPYEFN